VVGNFHREGNLAEVVGLPDSAGPVEEARVPTNRDRHNIAILHSVQQINRVSHKLKLRLIMQHLPHLLAPVDAGLDRILDCVGKFGFPPIAQSRLPTIVVWAGLAKPVASFNRIELVAVERAMDALPNTLNNSTALRTFVLFLLWHRSPSASAG
jgi:hypothetical protein